MKILNVLKITKEKRRWISLFLTLILLLTIASSSGIPTQIIQTSDNTPLKNTEDRLSKEAYDLLLRSQSNLKNGNNEDALKEINYAIHLNDKLDQLYLQRGNIYTSIQEYDKAIADYSKALSLNSSLTNVYEVRGHLYYEKGDFTNALSDYETALLYDANNKEVLYIRSNIYIEQKKYNFALKDLDSLLLLEPNNSIFLSLKGDIYNNTKDYKNGIICYDSALLNLSSTNQSIEEEKYLKKFTTEDIGRIHFNRGSSLVQMQNYKSAIKDFTSAIGSSYNTEVSHFQRGICYYVLEKYSTAASDLEVYFKSFPQNSDSWIYLAISYYNLNKYDKAISYFQKCIDSKIMIAESNYHLASISLEKKEYSKAVSYYTSCINLNFKKEYCLFNRGVAYLHLENKDAAKKDFEVVVQIATDKTIKASAQDVLTQF